MMTVSMRERIIRRVELLIDTHCPKCETQLAGDPEEIADAVLDVLAEPDEGMLRAANDWYPGDDPDFSERWAKAIEAARSPALVVPPEGGGKE